MSFNYSLSLKHDDILMSHSMLLYRYYIIQLMHSFEVDIKICQPEKSDVHRGKAKVNTTFNC